MTPNVGFTIEHQILSRHMDENNHIEIYKASDSWTVHIGAITLSGATDDFTAFARMIQREVSARCGYANAFELPNGAANPIISMAITPTKKANNYLAVYGGKSFQATGTELVKLANKIQRTIKLKVMQVEGYGTEDVLKARQS